MRKPSPRFIDGAQEGSAGDLTRSAFQSYDNASSIACRKRVSPSMNAWKTPLRGVGPGRKAGGPRLIGFGFSRAAAIRPPMKDDFHSRAAAPASAGELASSFLSRGA